MIELLGCMSKSLCNLLTPGMVCEIEGGSQLGLLVGLCGSSALPLACNLPPEEEGCMCWLWEAHDAWELLKACEGGLDGACWAAGLA